MDLVLRPATLADAKFLFNLRNESAVRSQFRNSNSVNWAEHLDWLNLKLNTARENIYICEFQKTDIGQLRIDSGGEISISIDPGYHGKGFGSLFLQILTKNVKSYASHELLIAKIKKDNFASQKAFVNAGFKKVGISKEFDDEYLIYNYP